MKRLFAVCVILALGACRPDDAPDPDAAAIVPASPPPAAEAAPPAPAIPPITIYHAEGRRSERIVWLMEELGLPYKLEFKRGDLAGSAARPADSKVDPSAQRQRDADARRILPQFKEWVSDLRNYLERMRGFLDRNGIPNRM